MYARVVIDAVIGNDDKIFDYATRSVAQGSERSEGSYDAAQQDDTPYRTNRISPGMRVLVPFAGRDVEGFVLGISDKTDVPADKIKPITKVLDICNASLTQEFLAILDEICGMFKLRKIDVLRLFVPAPIRGRKRKRVPKNKEIRAVNIDTKKVTLTEQQQAVADEICGGTAMPVSSLADSRCESSQSGRAANHYERQIDKRANALEAHTANRYGCASRIFVLHGVTGSGKTEVYMNVIERVLAQGKTAIRTPAGTLSPTAIMLVPEIGLTPQVLANFRSRFGSQVAMLHSGLTVGERYDEWLRLHDGTAKIAIGARSAIFAPVQNVGAIIIDEEHDGSYFSESNPRFHTHEIAKIRAKYNKCPLILGSATPSIETHHRAITGEYKLLRLDRRVNNLQMPTIELVDMAAELRSGNGGIFSRSFIEKLTKCMADGKQAIIFLNRRGFSSFIMCKNCGWTARCENCDVSLVYHKEDNQLKCHYCASRFTPISKCPECSSTYLKHGATGTQKVVEELEKIFSGGESRKPNIFRMDADNIKTKDDLVDILDEFGKTKSSILVGTQMVAKGHHFPNVSLVGIIDADNSLHFSDYRAAERTFALITQVAGRAGRATAAESVFALVKQSAQPTKKYVSEAALLEQNASESCGQVVLQTYMPTHYVYRLAANYDYAKFFDKEINTRQVTKYPPFTTVVRILVTGERDDQIKNFLQKIMTDLRIREKDFVYLGAMKSPLGRLQNKFRYQILARVTRAAEKEMVDFMDSVVKIHQPKNACSVFLEINPQSLS